MARNKKTGKGQSNFRSSYEEVGDMGAVGSGAQRKGFQSLLKSQRLQKQSEGRGYFSK